MNFHVGQKVVCIDDEAYLGGEWHGPHPVKGSVYTVRAVGVRHPMVPEEPCINVEEIMRELDAPFLARRFRPVKETNIDVFTAMLNPSPVKKKEKADA